MERPASGETVNDTLRQAVASTPDAVFLDFEGVQLTYRDVWTQRTDLARGLHALGVRRGDRVVTVLDTGPDAIAAWFAVHALGAVHVPINTAYKGEFLRHQIADSGARVAIAEADYAERILGLWDGTPELTTLLHRGDVEAVSSPARTVSPLDAHRLTDGELPEPELVGRDLASLIYTSGTTGPSKGCMISHNYLCDLARRFLGISGRSPHEVNWTPLPLFHIFAITAVLSSAQIGGTTSMAPRFSASAFWSEVERSGATIVNLLGSMASIIANAPDSPETLRCRGQLRSVLAVPFPQELKDVWRERFGVKWPGFSTYGQTESGSMVTCPIDENVPPGSSGRRNDTLDVRIFDENDHELPAGVPGEIVVRPLKPSVMFDGYWNRPAETLAVSGNYWHHTGDIGKFDEAGYFYFVDRQKDYLRRRGENISSFEVEMSLVQHPALAEAAVFAIPSELTEDDVKTCIVLMPGQTVDPAELCVWASERIPFFALPRYIEIVDELPKNPVGRVLKFELRDRGVTPETWDRETSDVVITRR